MAKRKTKKEEVIDLKPKAEKITEEQLKDVQSIINNINMSELEVGRLESRKHRFLHNIAGLNDKLTLIQSELEKEYGTSDINIQTGEIKYPKDNGEAN
tara:strand:+ start:651 stop:944 length:294 start_codon:yes stop_codon:yes gene_type:complete